MVFIFALLIQLKMGINICPSSRIPVSSPSIFLLYWLSELSKMQFTARAYKIPATWQGEIGSILVSGHPRPKKKKS
jgi:hypothetical protein